MYVIHTNSFLELDGFAVKSGDDLTTGNGVPTTTP